MQFEILFWFRTLFKSLNGHYFLIRVTILLHYTLITYTTFTTVMILTLEPCSTSFHWQSLLSESKDDASK